jgi:hypothetical protein
MHCAIFVVSLLFSSYQSFYIADEIYTTVRMFLEHDYTNSTDIVYCMMEHLRKDGTIVEVFYGISSEEMVSGNVEEYLQKIELKCNASFMATPLGISIIISVTLVLLGSVVILLCKFMKH